MKHKLKRNLKRSLKVFLLLPILLLILFSGFRAVEHVRGNEFISYLSTNIETRELGTAFDFELMREDLEKSSLILVGEIHGFKEPTAFDPEFFAHLNRVYGVTDYLLEMDPVQAHYMNRYNETGDEALLDRILEKWVVNIGRETLEYKTKWMRLREVYQHQNHFRYLGNNGVSDIPLWFDYVGERVGEKLLPDAKASDSVRLTRLKDVMLTRDWPEDMAWEKEYLLTNIEYQIHDKYREEVLTENLLELYEHYDLESRKVYGYYGLGHTLLSTMEDGYDAMASRFLKARPGMRGRVLAANFIFLDSYMTVYSKNQPEFLRDEGRFTQLPVSYDNIWLSYLHGLDELKRLTTPQTKTIVRLDGPGSPYRESRRLSTMSKILPIGMVLNAAEDKATTDYYQYLLFVRDTPGALPRTK